VFLLHILFLLREVFIYNGSPKTVIIKFFLIVFLLQLNSPSFLKDCLMGNAVLRLQGLRVLWCTTRCTIFCENIGIYMRDNLIDFLQKVLFYRL